MNAFELYNAVFDSANDYAENTVDYIKEYAYNALDINVSDDVANKIVSAHNAWEASEKGSNNFYHLVEVELENIEI